LDQYRQVLLALGRRIRGDVLDLSNEALRKSGGEASGNLSNAPMHLADLGTDTYEQEMSVSLLENSERALEEIAAALDRIDQGTFGRCEECGRDIGRERLRAIPYTRHCVDCARRLQGEGTPAGFP
jgi:RNA polymerase-binding transcription factor DksA